MAMKVLMTTDTVGGVWTYALELGSALRARGADVTLAAMGGRASIRRAADAASRGIDVHDSDYLLEWMDDPWRDVEAAGDWLLDLERRTEPDIIHLNNYAHGSLPFRAPTLMVAHSCVLSWWWSVKDEAAPDSWDRYRAAVREGLEAADLIVAPTQAMRNALGACYGDVGRCEVVYNGRDGSPFAPGTKRKLVFSAGRLWDEAKNLSALDAAAPSLRWPVAVAGDTRDPAGRGRGARHVACLGRLDPARLAGWMSRAGIYALPARYEPFGLSVLEAAHAGCALVLGDIATLRELWHGCAAFVDPEDPRTLAEAVNALAQDAERRGALAEAARRRAAELTPQRMAEGYLELYGRLLGRRALSRKEGRPIGAAGR